MLRINMLAKIVLLAIASLMLIIIISLPAGRPEQGADFIRSPCFICPAYLPTVTPLPTLVP